MNKPNKTKANTMDTENKVVVTKGKWVQGGAKWVKGDTKFLVVGMLQYIVEI